MRPLTEFEQKNVAILADNYVDFCLIEPTRTGLEKSIMDATFQVKSFLYDNNLHDYEVQKQGPENKNIIAASFLSDSVIIDTHASLYRPVTKSGDPRIWFSKLSSYANPNDILALFVHDDVLCVINITSFDLQLELAKKSGAIYDYIAALSTLNSSVAQELLLKIRTIAARGFVPSVMKEVADTAVGRTLETLLGIDSNSSKKPDYKGIELKSFRASSPGRESRKSLFAQVPNWEISQVKSSKEILLTFGYPSGNDFKLYCTVSSRVKNSQGLSLRLNSDTGVLYETSDKKGYSDFVGWLMTDLHKRLVEKHNETFWVKATQKIDAGTEYFLFKKIYHSRKPIASQFDALLEQGIITLDHLIKRRANGRVSEKGPLFKIESSKLQMLFPPMREYDL